MTAHALFVGTICAEAAPEITVFGDSYSRVPRDDFPNWVTQLQAQGKVGTSNNFAASANTAAKVDSRSFASQLKRWSAAGKPVGDYTVVFLGVSDVFRLSGSFSKSKAGYTSGLKTLDKAGAALILVQPPDVGTAPAFSGKQARRITARAKEWGGIVRKTAESFGVPTVDLFTALGTIPKSLYSDSKHLGEIGQGMIAAAIAAELTGPVEVASTLKLGTRNLRRARADTAAGLALATAPDDRRLGLAAFPIGAAALAQAEPASDPARAQFTAAFAPDRRDGGAGFTYALGDATTLGMTIASYADTDRSRLELGSAEDRVRSDLVGLHLDQAMGALTLRSRLGYGRDRHETERFNELTGSHDRASFAGNTLELAQRVGYDLKHEGYTLAPWAELAYERQTTESFTLSNPYLADQTFAAAPVSDTLGRIGVDLALEPLQLGGTGWLSLHAGLAYTHGLIQDDYRISTRQAGLGSTDEATIERPPTRTVGFDLAASLDLGQRLTLDAGLSLQHDLNTGTEQAARLALSYRF